MSAVRAGRLALALVFVAAAGLASAGEPMDAAAINDTFSGITLDGVYQDGSFFSETYNEDGTIRYHDVDRADSGEWSVKDRTFCTFYEGQEGACFFVERDGANCFTFFAAVEDSGGHQVPEDAWTSRGWNRDHAPTCPKPPEAAI
jgi:hypothetical protein